MPPIVEPDIVTCCGMEIKFPVGQNHHVAYPFGLHSTMQIPWNYYSEGDRFYIYLTVKNAAPSSRTTSCITSWTGDAAPPRGRRARAARVDSDSESGPDHGAAQGPSSPDSDDDYELEYAGDPIHVPIPASTYLLPPLVEDDVDRAIEHYVLPAIDYTGQSGTAVATTSGSDAHTDMEMSSLNTNPPVSAPQPIASTVSPILPTPQAPILVQNNVTQTATGRPQRNKRKVADHDNGDEDPLKSCDCGLIIAGVDATDPLLTIRCNNGACQTIWPTPYDYGSIQQAGYAIPVPPYYSRYS
ncbi:hypothetical protein DFH06DRAFT_1332786 [Mycena polygramma]|nr:hypothetical protein DFH06DRAFT_1332786 [Mycena polygramma]